MTKDIRAANDSPQKVRRRLYSKGLGWSYVPPTTWRGHPGRREWEFSEYLRLDDKVRRKRGKVGPGSLCVLVIVEGVKPRPLQVVLGSPSALDILHKGDGEWKRGPMDRVGEA